MIKILIMAALCFASVVGLAQTNDYDWRKDLPIQPRIKQAPRTMVFSQAQLKYGLKPYGSYYNRWTDWPLFIDPELAEPGESQSHPKMISYPDYVRRQQIVRQYGLDGFIVLPDNFRWDTSKSLYDFTDRSNVEGFLLLSVLYRYDDKPVWHEPKDMLFKKLDAILNCRNHLRVNGRAVILNAYDDDERVYKAMPEIKARYGDKFVFIKELHPAFKGSPIWQFSYRGVENKITKDNLEALKEYYRKYLRMYDGVYFRGIWAQELDHGYRKFYLDYYRDFLLRVIKSVMSEPEFKDKYMMLEAKVGHQNPWRLGYCIGSDATKSLRHSFEAALSADPDFINIPEWDEQNENTSLRPTVYNSLAHMRIMRYYMSQIKGEPLVALEGDDSSIPNLVISTRKILSLGERLGIELLNIPDSAEEFTYTVKLLLKDSKGKVVHEFPELTFNANKMYDHTLYVPSENFADHQVLRPALEIKYKGKTLSYEDGLHCVEFWPVYTYDYKWVKQPLRDLLPMKAAECNEVKKSTIQTLWEFVSGNGDPVVKTYSVKLDSPEKLNYVEVIDSGDCVYSHDESGAQPCRENKDQLVFRVVINSIPWGNFSGKLSLENGVMTTINPPRMWMDGAPAAVSNTITFKNRGTSAIAPGLFMVIDRKDADKAVLNIDLPGIYQGRIPIKDLLEKHTIAIPGRKGFSMSIQRYLKQFIHPRHLKKNNVNFTVNLIPDMSTSVILVQAISENGKIWRSRPMLANTGGFSGAKKKITVYSETTGQPVMVDIAAERVPDLEYEITDRLGSILPCSAGRLQYGIRGGYIEQAILRGGCEASYGNPFYYASIRKEDAITNWPDNAQCAPVLMEDDGSLAMKFDGERTHVVLPMGAIPRRAGFKISMKIKPETVTGKQFILANRFDYGGAFSELYIDEGILKGSYLNHKTETTSECVNYELNSFLKIPAGKWSDMKISYDLKFMTFEVNGEKSKPMLCPGPGRFDNLTVIGGWDKYWFKGLIKDVKIKHAQ